MQAPQRRSIPAVIARLEAAPFRFQFVQAVRLLLVWLRRDGVRPGLALRDLLRFENSLSLGFPPSQIAALFIDTPDDAAAVPCVRLTPAFIGLLGAHGTLPLHYTEGITTRARTGEYDAARAWFDLFSDRTVSLFFQAWGKFRFEHTLDVHGQDDFQRRLLALGARTVGPLHADLRAFYIGLLRQRPISVATLRSILPDYFGVPIAIEQFVGAWDDIADDRQCKLNGPNATLGHSAGLGVRLWRHALCLRLRIGPLGKASFERFLPGADGAGGLDALLQAVDIPGLEYLVHVVLRPQDVPLPGLVGGCSPGVRIGWDACLAGAGRSPPTEVRYRLRPALINVSETQGGGN